MVRQEFKHLKPDEKIIAQRFYDQGHLIGEYEYDLHLTTPDVNFPAHWTKKDLEHWSALRDKRIDIVVHAAAAEWIIEVTPKLSKAAIGGCVTYRELYMRQFNPKYPVHLGIVVEVDDLAYHDTLKRYGITLWVV
jgi:hypothetical protein